MSCFKKKESFIKCLLQNCYIRGTALSCGRLEGELRHFRAVRTCVFVLITITKEKVCALHLTCASVQGN